MRQARLWLGFAAVGLVLQACAQQGPSGPTARVFAADMTGAAKVCSAPPVTPAAGQTQDVAIKLGNDGGWCAITVNNNGSLRVEGDFEIVDPTGKPFGLAGRTGIMLFANPTNAAGFRGSATVVSHVWIWW